MKPISDSGCEKHPMREVERLKARLAFATTFQFPDGKHIQCFFEGDRPRTQSWYVFDNHHDSILATDGTWTPDKDGWDERHRFATADDAFAAMERAK